MCSPEKVRCGVDIVLHTGFSLANANGTQRPVFMRQRSRLSKVSVRLLLIA